MLPAGGCGIAATPAVRRQLLALAVAVLAPAGLADPADAQQRAGGTVRLIVGADVLAPEDLQADDQALLWMSPESAFETERVAATWAAGGETEALRAWKSVVRTEAASRRPASEDQLAAASLWLAARVAEISSATEKGSGDPLSRLRLMAIRNQARSAALEALEGR